MSMTRNPFFAGLMMLFTAAAFTPCRAGSLINIVGTASAGGYNFINFDGPNSATTAGTGTNMNGLSNTGAAVGFTINNNGNFQNFVANPYGGTNATVLNINGNPNANAFGINNAGDVVGTDGNGNAFVQPHGGAVQTFIPGGGATATAFGINDNGNIVGQYTTTNQSPGFFISNSAGKNFARIDAPSGSDTVNAQGINNNGQIVGFYVGTDGQDHGFTAKASQASNGELTGTGIADPAIPVIPGEPGATFVFSQILGVNDQGLAVGYFGDSTTSQHGFIYNLNTGTYTFADDPAEQFNNGVEVTQITGINNLDEITGFYSDANGVFHGFLACPAGVTCPASNPSAVPEPGSLLLAGLGTLVSSCFFSFFTRTHRSRA